MGKTVKILSYGIWIKTALYPQGKFLIPIAKKTTSAAKKKDSPSLFTKAG